MLTYFKTALISTVLFFSFNNPALANTCDDSESLYPCGIEFTSIPPMPDLSLANCSTPVTASYTLHNYASTPTLIDFSLTEVDSLSDSNALNFSVATTCMNHWTLDAGSSCNVIIDFQPCVPGNLDWNFTVTPRSTQRPLVLALEAVIPPAKAYVVNSGAPSLSYCVINSDGTFQACSTVTLTFGGIDALDVPWNLTINAANTLAYISNTGNDDGTTLSICPIIDATHFGSVGSPCVNTTGFGTFSTPRRMTFNADGSLLYVANATGTISICAVDVDGSFTSCDTVSAGTLPQSIAFNGDGTLAYVANMTDPGNIMIFDVDGLGNLSFNGNFTDPSLNEPSGFGIDNGGGTAFVSNSGNDIVSFCPINGSSFDPCFPFDGGGFFHEPADIALGGMVGYIPNLLPSGPDYTIAVCGGESPTCVALTDPTFNIPSQVLVVY